MRCHQEKSQPQIPSDGFAVGWCRSLRFLLGLHSFMHTRFASPPPRKREAVNKSEIFHLTAVHLPGHRTRNAFQVGTIRAPPNRVNNHIAPKPKRISVAAYDSEYLSARNRRSLTFAPGAMPALREAISTCLAAVSIPSRLGSSKPRRTPLWSSTITP